MLEAKCLITTGLNQVFVKVYLSRSRKSKEKGKNAKKRSNKQRKQDFIIKNYMRKWNKLQVS